MMFWKSAFKIHHMLIHVTANIGYVLQDFLVTQR